MHAAATRVLSIALVIIGVVMIARSIGAGGGPASTGIVLGVLFVAAGAGRLFVSRGSGA